MMARTVFVIVITGIASLAALGVATLPGGKITAEKDVYAFGVVGDGATDDAAALQKAVDAGLGDIHLRRGIYRLSHTIVIDLDKTGFTSFTGEGTAQLLMTGKGPALRLAGTHAGTAEPKTFQANVWNRQRTPIVSGLEIVGVHAEADGIEAEGTMQFSVRQVTIRRVRHGIHLVKRNRNLLVDGCHIYQNTGVGIYYDHVDLHQSNIVGCHVSYCDGGGVVSRGGDVRNIQISGCDIESNMSPKGPATANVLLDSTGGDVGEVAITGCTLQHNSPSPGSANIRILGRGKDLKLGETQEGHVTIAANVLSDVQINVDIQNARGVTITGNTFWMGYQHNLRVGDSNNIVVGPNVFDRNPRYNYGTSLQTTNSLVFRRCADCSLTGLHVNDVYKAEAGITLEDCRRFNVTGCTILDCEPIGLLAKNLHDSRVSDCLIKNDRAGTKSISMKVIGGRGNMFVNNWLASGYDIPKDSGLAQGNYQGK